MPLGGNLLVFGRAGLVRESMAQRARSRERLGEREAASDAAMHRQRLGPGEGVVSDLREHGHCPLFFARGREEAVSYQPSAKYQM